MILGYGNFSIQHALKPSLQDERIGFFMLDDKSVQPTANKNAIVGIVKFFAALIIIGGITYSEILFLGIVSSLFPSGPMMIGAMLGAVTTGVSILVLCLGKSHWFRPGTQLIVAWIFTGVEIAVLILNDILAYQIHQGGTLDQYMASWRLFCVAAPVISIVGWVLIFYFDPQRAITHRRMEMEDNQSRSQIDFETMMHRKVMQFQYRSVDMVSSQMEAQIAKKLGPVVEQAAAQQLARIASQLTGSHISPTELGSPQISAGNPKVVESNPPAISHNPVAKPTKAASSDHVLDPEKVKPRVDSEPKKLDKPKSFGQLLGEVHTAFHTKIDKALDRREQTAVEQSPIEDDTEEIEVVDPKVTTVFIPHPDSDKFVKIERGTFAAPDFDQWKSQEEDENPQ
jgi:hypothetical protein